MLSPNKSKFGKLARVGKGCKLKKLQTGSVRELRKAVGKSYMLPRV